MVQNYVCLIGKLKISYGDCAVVNIVDLCPSSHVNDSRLR